MSCKTIIILPLPPEIVICIVPEEFNRYLGALRGTLEENELSIWLDKGIVSIKHCLITENNGVFESRFRMLSEL